eukprot:TRINITY_DN2827_c0_g1_i4.p1 TRINITY_DN2827_c0_g1~~TRINITY_DN2827_c0_g1_i4.p1  ORF type:complete len:472 (+),score=132.60 TRINITY_DN2827_c0_g1_i4:122-1417(+)
MESLQRTHRASQSDGQQMLTTMKNLEMQLVTVKIKIEEAEDSERNYEQNITHLQAEELENLLMLDELRQSVNANKNLLRKVIEMKDKALHDRDQAQAEMDQFRREITEYKGFVEQQAKTFEEVSRIMKEASETRDQEREKKEEQERQKVSAKLDKYREIIRQKEQESEQLQTQLNEYNKKLQRYENNFQQITQATGLMDTDEIITKFFLKEDIRTELKREVEEKTRKFEELKASKEEYVAKLQEKKDTFVDSKWRDVGAVQDRVREAVVRAEKRQSDIDRMTQKLAVLQEGIISLIRRVHRALGHSDQELSLPSELSAPSCAQLLQIFDSKISQLMRSLHQLQNETVGSPGGRAGSSHHSSSSSHATSDPSHPNSSRGPNRAQPLAAAKPVPTPNSPAVRGRKSISQMAPIFPLNNNNASKQAVRRFPPGM